MTDDIKKVYDALCSALKEADATLALEEVQSSVMGFQRATGFRNGIRLGVDAVKRLLETAARRRSPVTSPTRSDGSPLYEIKQVLT